MAIKTWHVGKIVMLWAWGIAVIFVDLHLLQQFKSFLTEHVLTGFSVLAILLLVPLALSILTWRWFSAKEAVLAKSIIDSELSTPHHRAGKPDQPGNTKEL
jgi:hypothetical protein